MAEFYPAVEKVLNAEGGYQNNPSDWGNYNAYDSIGRFVPYNERKGQTLQAGTNRGISAGLYSGLLGREVSVEEMKNLSRDAALEIYRKVYWDKMKGDLIQPQKLAELIFDSYVNHGTTGLKLLQRVLNALGGRLQEDGAIGPITLAELRRRNPAKVFNGLLQAREALYRHLAENREGNRAFLQGWLNRLKKFQPMAVAASPVLGLGLIALLWALTANDE